VFESVSPYVLLYQYIHYIISAIYILPSLCDQWKSRFRADKWLWLRLQARCRRRRRAVRHRRCP